MSVLVPLSLCSDVLSLSFSSLQIRKFPTSNTYMDDPFSLTVTDREQPVYSNTSILEHRVRSAQSGVRWWMTSGVGHLVSGHLL